MGVAVCIGVALRLWGLRGQIIFGDELHAIQSVASLDLRTILTTYRLADHCIPMAAYDRLLVLWGFRLTELLVRMPSVVAGLATLVALPIAVSRVSDRATVQVFGWLLALSPSLVFYSRIARPYAIVVLLGFGAAACFWAFRETRRPLWGLAYAICGAAATWFHPGVGPFAAAPLVFAGVEGLAGERSARLRRLVEVVCLGGGLAAFVALFLVPGLPSFLTLVRAKSADIPPELADLPKVFLMQSGSVSLWIAGLFWLVVAWGFVTLWRRSRPLALYSATLVVVQAATVGFFRPSQAENMLVLNRYMLVTLPATLLWAAVGLTALWALPRGRLLARGAVAASVLGLVATHPYVTDPWLRLGAFGASNAAAAFFRPVPELPEGAVPKVYRLLGRESGSGTVIEVLSAAAWYRARPEVALARIHRRPVVFATTGDWLQHPALAFRTLVPTTPEAVLASGARFVVLDLDRQRSWVTIAAISRRGLDPKKIGAEQLEQLARHTPPTSRQVQFARRMAARFEAAWGPPQLVDGTVRVWDLAVVTAQ